MKESNSLGSLLREWKAPEPSAELDEGVMATYRSAVRPPRRSPPFWERFWTMRVNVPAPALVAMALVIFGIFVWLRPLEVPAPAPGQADVVTRLNADGFQPLSNGEARIIPAVETQK